MQIRSVGLLLCGWLWSGLVAGTPTAVAAQEGPGGMTRPVVAQQVSGLVWDPVRPDVRQRVPAAATPGQIWIGERPADAVPAPIIVAPQRASGFERLRRSLPYGVTHNLVIRYLNDE